MVDRPTLSKAELDVARRVWDAGQATVRQVYEAIDQERSIDFSTVQTFLRRLEKKGYLKSKTEGRTRVYSPRVQRKTVIRETVGDLVQRLFGGDSMPLVMHLIEDPSVDVEQLGQLRELIDQVEAQQATRTETESKTRSKTESLI